MFYLNLLSVIDGGLFILRWDVIPGGLSVYY